MLIDFRELWPKYNIKPSGVLHIGGNVGEEAPVYLELGVERQVWYEPNPDMFVKLENNISNNPNAVAHNLCVGDENKNIVLHLSNNAGQSSSVLELGTHLDAHPEVHYVNDIVVPMIRLDSFYQSLVGTNFLNVDVQGFELNVLKGMGHLLNDIKWAYLEVNKAPLYIGCALVEEIDEYLSGFGFSRVETLWAGNTNWGDALYIKN
jgi:FkbM family methyltransferase